jgi:hypothetical protein
VTQGYEKDKENDAIKSLPSHRSLKSKGAHVLLEMKQKSNVVYLPRTRQQREKKGTFQVPK